MTPEEYEAVCNDILDAVRVYHLPPPIEVRFVMDARPVGIKVNLEDVAAWLPVLQEPNGPTIINLRRPVHQVTGRLFGTETWVRVSAEEPAVAAVRQLADA